LVVVVGSAVPHLHPVSIGENAISKVEALVHVGPGDTVIGGIHELLVPVDVGAIPNLHLHPISGGTVGDVQALVTKHSESTVDVGPRLTRRSIAILDSHSSAVIVETGG